MFDFEKYEAIDMKYDLIGFKNYEEIYFKRKEIIKKVFVYHYDLIDFNGTKVKSLVLPMDEAETKNLDGWQFVGRMIDSEIEAQVKEYNKQLKALEDEFQEIIKDQIFKDLANHFSIKESMVRKIVEVALNRQTIVDQLTNEDGGALAIENIKIDGRTAKILFNIIENEIELLKMTSWFPEDC